MNCTHCGKTHSHMNADACRLLKKTLADLKAAGTNATASGVPAPPSMLESTRREARARAPANGRRDQDRRSGAAVGRRCDSCHRARQGDEVMLTRQVVTHVKDRLADSKLTLADIDDALPELEAHEQRIQSLMTEIGVAIPAVDDTTNRHDEGRAQDMRADLRLLEDGVHGLSGVTNPTLSALAGLPGLHETRRLLARLRAARDEAVARETQPWPRPFRLKGGQSHHAGNRRYKAGDVVELTESQAAAFADKFERVEATTS